MGKIVQLAARSSQTGRRRPRFRHDRALATSRVLGFDLVDEPMAKTVYWIADRAQAHVPTHVAFLNAHCANIARKDWRYQDTLRHVDALLPDGSGVALAAKLEGERLAHNLNGTDLFGPLCRCLTLRGLPVFFLGARRGVAEAAVRNAQRAYPNLKIAGHRHGYFSPREEDQVVEQINASGARVVFVAFGAPEQDIWLARIRSRLHAPVVLGVGGLLDFVSERIPRAPLWMRRMGAEWLHRLRCEPGRMWRRYLVGNLSFACHAAAYAFRRRTRATRHRVDRACARFIDIAAAGMGLAALAPLLMLVAIAIRLESRGPALFRQVRVGEDGRRFEILKFRSMRTDAQAETAISVLPNDRDDGVTFKLKRDPRVTRIGRFIRKFSIDELPQLWNVLRGDMALVGPRPALPAEVEKYSKVERRRLRGKPGITCLWQISGRADLPFARQVVLDVAYLRSRSVWLDLAILLRTPAAVLTAKGAY